MIILDLSQVMLSNLMMQIGNHTNAKIEENMVRHMVLNSIRSYRNKFSSDYGELVIACDNKNYWRKQIFPYYKANRKKNIEKSELDWNSIFECMNKLRAELKEFFPYRVIDIETAEADDIIATLVKMTADSTVGEDSTVLILSGDKDFIQLHRYKHVKQYDPVRKKWVSHPDPSKFLLEHILKGDAGDGIPNILSPDSCFVMGERQKPLTQKKIDTFMSNSADLNGLERNYMRNKMLIDLDNIPEDLAQKIRESYIEQAGKDRSRLFNYFIANKLKMLVEHLGEF